MCSISDIPCVGAALNHISEATVGAVYRGIRYILFYKDNVDKLNSEIIKGLNAKEQEIERQVDQAKNNGKIIKEHVVQWQDDVKVFKAEVTEFLKKYEGRTSCRCFNVLRCPNPYRRFQLGRWAAKKTTTVIELSDLEKKQLTGEISYFPPIEYRPISSTEYQKFGSREVAYEKILKALNYKEDGFPVVGVYGFGGVGKTRMMEEASKEVKAKGTFKTVARANVGQVEVGQKVDMIGKIQDQLAIYLNITEKSEDRTSQLTARLSKGDTILVILDDVWSEIPFAEIGIPFGDSSIKGCKILLTSRLQRVCLENNCKDPVEIEALTEDEAWGMFTKTVGISTIQSLHDDSLARQVCNKCARLPLIIGAVGKALRAKSDIWKDALPQLKNCKPENIQGLPPDAYACLRLSFNILVKDAYLCLLLCSLAGEDEEIRIEFLFRLAAGSGLLKDWKTLEDARNRVNAMLSELKSSLLLLEGRDDDSVKLHDIIRDVARSITHDEESEYKFLSESNCHSLWRKEDILSSRKLIYLDFKSDNVDFFDDLEPCPDLHSLYLKYSNLSDVQLPDSFFKSFPKLKYLLLDIKSLSAMPSSIQNLDSLRSLAIDSCKVIDISHIIQLKNLEMLTLQNSYFGDQLLDLRQLRRLRMLDMTGCFRIMGIVLSGLECLEELYLPMACNILDKETLRKTPLSSVTSKLTSLEIYFEDVKSCPDENICKNLCRYKIGVGDTKFLSAMKSVHLCNGSIGGGVKTLVERGEEVTLERVTGGLQECFSQGGGAFTDLKRLRIHECTGGDEYLSRIHRQPDERGGPFSNLSRLYIYNSGFKYLFCTSTERCLPQLKVLLIFNCQMMEEIVRNEGQIINFPKLRELRLSSLPAFLKSFCGKVVFPALERLGIRDLDNITEIWEEHGHLQESFCQLKFLEVEGCHKLKNVIPYAMRQRLQNLNMLRVSKCDSLISEVQGPIGAEIAEPLVVLPNLKELKLLKLPKLMETGLNSSDIILYPNLTTLYIEGCDNLRNVFLPSVASHLKLLQKLKIKSCGMMNEIIASDGKDSKETRVSNIEFPMLKELELQGLPKMNSLWGYGIVEPNLDQQKSSQAYKVIFPALEELEIYDLDNITEIWEDHGHLQESFCQLKFLKVEGCHKLKNVIPYAMCQRLQNLNKLHVSKCDSLIFAVQGPNGAEIAKPLVVLPNLTKLKLYELPKLMEIGLNSSDIILYPNLTSLVINRCNNLRDVFLPSVASHLKLLKKLKIRYCEMMNAIIAPVRKDGKEIRVNNIEFPMLKRLELEGLPKMNSLWGYGIVEPNLDQQKTSQARKVSFPSLGDLSLDDSKINSEKIYLGRDLESLRVSNCNFYECDLFSLLGNSAWKNNPYGTISFRRLMWIDVNSCMLSTIFTCSIAKGLQELEELKVRSCRLIEEIVTDERRNDQVVMDTCEEISFPKLWVVELEDLPNLKSFCHSANYCFKMPSLMKVYITKCPQMLSFTPRQISTPEVYVSIKYPSLHGEEYTACEQSTTDINSYLHQIMNTQELFVDKKEELKPNRVDK